MNYIPLYVKTSYSMLSSLCDIKKLVRCAKEIDIKALAITDNNMYGTLEFYKECKKNNIKPIIGLELKINEEILLLYAKNYKGYQNLTNLTYINQDRDLNYEDLKKYNANLICIVLNIDLYKDLTSIYINLYLGYSNDYIEKSLITNNLVYINKVLCLKKEDIKYLKYLYLIKEGKKIDSIDEYNVDDNCYLEYSIKSDFEIENEIIKMCNIDFNYNPDLFPIYSKDINSKDYLMELSKKGLIKRFGSKVKKSYYDRLLYELDIINKMKFNDCFLVAYDYVKYARKNKILIGPGRGSAACSLVSYCLGITEVDPIKYDLLFERFLNVERISMPDIDIDFESNNREKVIDYVINKYSNVRAVPIITFSSLSGRQVIRDVGKILNIDIKKIDRISKIIGYNSLNEAYLKNKDLKSYIESNNLDSLMDISLNLDGLKRQISLHAAGIIISNLNLYDYIPLQKYNEIYISGFSMEHLEELGLLKLDLLGLKDLTLIEKVLGKINIDYNNIPLDDEKTYNLFKNGYTDGIFQFESDGMKNFLKKLKPDSFDDIIAAIALFRPGPSSNIDDYIKRKYRKEKFDYIHEDLEEILSSTYGIIIYQEQIMKIANKIANYSLGEADVLRRAISKKKKEVLMDEESKFINRSIENGYSEDLAKEIYQFILKFANYGFNKAHSVGYSILAYRMAYLKANYTKEFLAELLTNVIGQENKTKKYIEECKKMNINILKPCINESLGEYKAEPDGIRYSLSAIKNIGSSLSKEILNERAKGEYKDIFDFVSRTYKFFNRKMLESLIDSNSFDLFGYNHKTMINNLDLLITYGELNNGLGNSSVEKPLIEVYDEYTKEELSKREIDVFGFYLSNHPVISYKLNYENIINSIDISNYFNKEINMILMIDNIKEINTKNGKQMAFVKGSDEFGSVDLVLFPKVYENNKIEIGNIFLIKGNVEKNMSKYQIVVSNLKKN
ncbi:MAG: DNA polymerase III subunit alpha [Bacilli bacterium]|nr:DNA polymerase III subunit alpha [Bacilli bacterium]